MKDSETGCNQKTFGFMSLKRHGQTFLPEPGTSIIKEHRLGQRITKNLNVKFSTDDLEMLRQFSFDLSDFQNAAMEANLPLGNAFVYCAPCVCAVRTALTICEEGSSKYLRYTTRVDDRISAICCPGSTKIGRLISLVTIVKQIEATDNTQTTGLNIGWIEYIDRVWIEQRVYQLEEEFYAQSTPRSTIAQGEELFAELQCEYKETGIVILGELDHCLWMLQTQPFPWKARIPKEAEIFKLAKTPTGSAWERTYLGTYTPRAFQPFTTILNSVPFPNLSRTQSTNDSTTTHLKPKVPTLDSVSQKFMGDGIEISGQIPNKQLTTNPISSISPNDTTVET